jgi:hypothetical protein
MKLFLDIDGVLLTKRGNLAEGAETFLLWAIRNHDPFWISTRTRDGSHRGALRAFHDMIDPATIRAIRPTQWDTLKTEPLPLGTRDWAWIDDEILHTERAILTDNGALDRFVQTSVDRNPSALVELPDMPIFLE